MEQLRISVEQEKYSEATPVRKEILHRVEEAQAEASAELLANLRHMVNDPTFSDVAFICNDGKRVQASRLVLAGRSAVLKGMLMSGMVESSLSEIELPEVSSPVLLCVFEFLYTGTLTDYYPKNWRMACEVIIGSRFFLLPKLDILTRQFMLKQTSVVAEDLRAAASMLTEALECKALCDEKDISLRELVTILSSNWSESIHLTSLSEDAFHYLLVSTKCDCEDNDKLSFQEYLRFRQVIRWWVCQSHHSSVGAEELVDFITLDEKRALSIYRNLSEGVESPGEEEDAAHRSKFWRLSQLDEKSRNGAVRLLSHIDFRIIHPVLLATVVEPLKIISFEEILSAFRFHALRRPKNFQRLECAWEHGESHSTLERGYVIHKSRQTIGSAVMIAPMYSSFAIYEWHFIVDQIPLTFCELGFTGELLDFEGEKLSDHHYARVVDFLVAGARISLGGAERHDKWKTLGRSLQKGSKATFHFNALDGTCSLILDGEDYGIVWEHLPRGIYFPAVSLGASSEGVVRVELVSGFE